MATPEELARLQQLGPQGRMAPSFATAAQQPVLTGPGGASQQGVIPPYTVQPSSAGPRGGGAIVTPRQQPAPVQAPAPAAPASVTPTIPPTTQRVAQAPAGAVRRITSLSGLSAENQRVIEQDRANMQAATAPSAAEVGEVPMPTSQGPTYADKKGDYSMTGTSPSVIADARRRADTGSGGVNFGFAPGEARAYLDKMAGQDAAKVAQAAQRRQEIDDDVARIGLRNAMTQGTPQERRAARLELQALDTRAAQRLQETGDTTRAGMGLAAELQRAQTTAGANLAAAQATAAGRLQAAQVEGQYGLQAAMAKADAQLAAEVAKGVTPQAELAARRAQLIEQQMILAAQAQQAGDVGGTYAALGLSRPQAPQVYTNPITGAPLSPQEIEMLQRQNIGMLTQPQ